MPQAAEPLILDGIALRDLMVVRIAERMAAAGNPKICLATVLVGDDAPSHTYVRNKHKFAAAAGLKSRNEVLPATASQTQVEDLVGRLAADPAVHGILVQQPLPAHLDNDAVLHLLPAEKDVDGLTTGSLGRLVRGEPGLVPCTPLGVLRLLEHYKIPPAGRHAVIVGRSTLVGTPLAILLSRKGVDATATIAHSRTANLAELCRS
ncbi:MAG: bifunctional 5,10-methylenetetrahydrofolate dehydrogenase/5,10-methenyltetrahydrofolate cyclohydrolase, partial [Ilumatobacteraceae bacterium]|nr:bifunctional 5,10-methylenetetrahydrofolate dehydrogenase/5,10-methenyltetrahydrofolate cyclohydrolase [Ilumatobacteraceae bacterium]